jgi:hypothetical protein
MTEALTLAGVTGTVRAIAAVVNTFAKFTSTAKADAAFAETVTDMAIEANANTRSLADRIAAVEPHLRALSEAIFRDYAWQERAEDEQPTTQDFLDGFLALTRAAKRAGTNRKREILYRAFYRRFDPTYYLTGQSTLLWEISNVLEYPDFLALEDVRVQYDAALADRKNSHRISRPAAVIRLHSEHWPHIARLEAHGLVYGYKENPDLSLVLITALGRALIAFAWLPPGERPDEPATED